MRVPAHVVDARRRRLAELLSRKGYLPLPDICAALGVSAATARRDLAHLAADRRITRTYGGALADFNLRFPSFRDRQTIAATGKKRIARLARDHLQPGWTVYFDSGTTVYAVAEAITANPIRPLTAVTNNLPVATLLSGIEGVAVQLLGGDLLPRQSVLLGEGACRGASWRDFDLALLGAEGATREGIWNSTADVVRLQRTVASRASRTTLCIDGSKLGRTAAQFLFGWDAIHLLLTDASPDDLATHGIPPAAPPPPPSRPTPHEPPGPEPSSGLTLPVELL